MMKFDFSNLGFKKAAFWDRPLTFFAPATREFMATMMEIAAIETGNRIAREHWQMQQFGKLLTHAAGRSAFWKKRLGLRNLAAPRLASIPVLVRRDLAAQVAAEGPLLAEADGPLISRSTSGSTGMPVRFFISTANARFNSARGIAQYLVEGRSLLPNRTRFKLSSASLPGGLKVAKKRFWLGPEGTAIPCGSNKEIEINDPNPDLLSRELRADLIGYLIASPKTIDLLLQHFNMDFFKQQGTEMWIPYSEAVDERLRLGFIATGIKVRATYSAEEVGPIAYECASCAGFYHVACSNVIVETVDDAFKLIGEDVPGRVLVTHLHSYATPIIRYDIGDVAHSHERCPCGHDGPTLSKIQGRKKGLIKHRDGSLSVFFIGGDEMRKVAAFDEYRIRQISLDEIVAEIGGRDSLGTDEIAGLQAILGARAGSDMTITVRPVPSIDWGGNTKRLGFHNEILD